MLYKTGKKQAKTAKNRQNCTILQQKCGNILKILVFIGIMCCFPVIKGMVGRDDSWKDWRKNTVVSRETRSALTSFDGQSNAGGKPTKLKVC